MERPAGGLPGVPGRVQQPRGPVGIDGDVEVREGNGEPAAQGLDEGLLARPAGEERGRPLRGGERAQGRRLRAREEEAGHAVALEIGPHLLEVDADLAPSRHGQDGLLLRMGEVEPRRLWPREARLALRPVGERDLGRRHAQVTREDLPQPGARGHETAAVARKPEGGGTPPLLRRQPAFEGLDPGAVQVEAERPDVYLAGRERRCFAGMGHRERVQLALGRSLPARRCRQAAS